MNKQLQIKCRRSQNNLKRSESDWRWELAFLHPKYVFPWCCKPYFSFSANCISPILKGRRELPCKRGKKSAHSALQQKCTLESASISKLLILLKTAHIAQNCLSTGRNYLNIWKETKTLKNRIFVANYFLEGFLHEENMVCCNYLKLFVKIKYLLQTIFSRVFARGEFGLLHEFRAQTKVNQICGSAKYLLQNISLQNLNWTVHKYK